MADDLKVVLRVYDVAYLDDNITMPNISESLLFDNAS